MLTSFFQTREKLKQTYEAEFAATIERAEKQILLAKHGRRLLSLLDDAPVAPGDPRRVYPHAQQARQILNDCEDDLRDWQPQPDEFGMEPPQEQPLLRQGTDGSGSLLSNDSTRGGGGSKARSRVVDEEDQSVAATDLRSERVDDGALNGGQQSEAAQIRA